MYWTKDETEIEWDCQQVFYRWRKLLLDYTQTKSFLYASLPGNWPLVLLENCGGIRPIVQNEGW